MRVSTVGFLAKDGVTVTSIYHVAPTWNKEHGADAESRDACKVCCANKVATTARGAKRASARAQGALTEIRKSYAAADEAGKTRRVSTERRDTPDDAKSAMVDAMRESMAEESSDESEEFRKRLTDSLARSSVNDTDENGE